MVEHNLNGPDIKKSSLFSDYTNENLQENSISPIESSKIKSSWTNYRWMWLSRGSKDFCVNISSVCLLCATIQIPIRQCCYWCVAVVRRDDTWVCVDVCECVFDGCFDFNFTHTSRYSFDVPLQNNYIQTWIIRKLLLEN